MTVDTQQGPPAQAPAGPPPKRPEQDAVDPVKPRRNMRLVLLGIALAVIFALLAVWAVGRAGEARSVVVVTNDVAAGDQVSSSDLATTTVRGGDDLSTVPGDDLQSIVGMRAAHPMPAGSLVNEEAFERRVAPRDGEMIVPISVTAAQYPASGLASGDSVRVVVTGGGASLEDLEPGTAFSGTVLAQGSPDDQGARTVDVSINDDDAPLAAAAAGTGNIMILNAAPGGTGQGD